MERESLEREVEGTSRERKREGERENLERERTCSERENEREGEG